MKKKNECIKILQKIQSAVNSTSLKWCLPRIVVVGPQSCGKSSVLEQILLKDFLPRGSDLVTRCPIILHLRNTDDKNEYVEFLHLKKQKFNDFKTIKHEITKQMEKNCGKESGISKIPIEIFFHSKNVFDMTLVDLPGLTKIPMGNQPSDIETQIENLILEYITPNSSFILAIINANVDVVNSEALKLSKKVDPDGVRTLGVITKIDIMDLGTNCLKLLNNQINPLEYGYIGIINKSQNDIDRNLSIEESLKKEDLFFKNHTVYKKIYPKVGSKFLVGKLYEIFLGITKNEIPKIKMALGTRFTELIYEKEELGEFKVNNKDQMFNMFYSYTRIITEILNGSSGECKKYSIFYFNEENRLLFEIKNLFEKIKIDYLRCSLNLKNEVSNSPSLFVSESLFNSIVKKRTEELGQGVLMVVEEIFQVILKYIFLVRSKRYDSLANKLNTITNNCLILQRLKLITSITEFMNIQCSYINLDHPDFSKITVLTKVLNQISKKRKGVMKHFDSWGSLFSNQNNENALNDQIFRDEEFEPELLSNLADSYFSITRKSFIDYSIKCIHYYFINFLKNELQNELNKQADKFDKDLFKEDSSILNQRTVVITEMENVKEALSYLEGI